MSLRPIHPLALTAILLAACASNPVQVRQVEIAELVQADQVSAYDGRRVSDRTLTLLDRLGMATADHAAAIDRLAHPIEALLDRDRHMARAELLYHIGINGDAKRAPHHFLAAAFDALQALGSANASMPPTIDPIRNRALELYSYALTRFLAECIRADPKLPELLHRLRSDFELEIDWQVRGPWRLEDFDRWILADNLEFSGLRHRYRRLGGGVPLIVQRDATRGIPDYLTPEAITRGVTVVLEPSQSPQASGRLRLLDPRTTRDTDILRGIRVPLAADFTAPFGYLLSQAGLHEIENTSFFSADAAGHHGLFLLEDYDPARRPIVMVHGLWSSPLTWRDLTNDIFGDETLHRHYQVWHYMYATGTPLLENARLMRQTLTRARRDLDPGLDDYATRELILVGHSMGGLLSRMSLLTTGEAMWNTLFEGSFDDVEPHLDDRDRELARRLYFWEPLSFVERVVFIAAPHRGSELSDSWIGRLGSSLMYIPSHLRGLVDKIRGQSGVRVEVPTSVDELSGSHPVMHTLDGLQIRKGVTYHSIMGDVSGSRDPKEWTDSVVPYASSHLDGAASELVIPNADHGVHFDPRASAEVRRILRDALDRGNHP